MTVYVFGNQDLADDNLALAIAKQLEGNIENVHFVEIKPNQDLPFIGEDLVVIMDVVFGINQVQVFDQDDLDKLILPPRSSVHDFDLGFQLKYLKKLGKLNQIRLIGIPMERSIDYSSVHSILRKLVAQDMHGS